MPNVMLLHYAELKRDMPAQIRRIAEFLEITIDESKWLDILEHCSFDYMKKHAAKSAPLGGVFWEGGAQTFIHKGTNGRWKDILTEADIARYEATALQNLGSECANWLATTTY